MMQSGANRTNLDTGKSRDLVITVAIGDKHENLSERDSKIRHNGIDLRHHVTVSIRGTQSLPSLQVDITTLVRYLADLRCNVFIIQAANIARLAGMSSSRVISDTADRSVEPAQRGRAFIRF